MERKLVQFTTAFTCVFSLLACVAVWYLPTLEQRLAEFNASIRQTQIEREERYAMLEKMSGLEILDYNTQQVIEEVKAQEKEEEKADAAENVKSDGNKHAAEKNKEQKKENREDPDKINSYLREQMMRLELPKHTKGASVEIVSDYVNREFHIRIPGADQNYLYDYQLIGKNDEITALNYASEAEHGTVVLKMGKVMEIESSFDSQYLYLDFKSPKEIYDRVVVIDAGHGGIAPGAVSGDIYEKNLTLAIVHQIKDLFEKAGDSKIGVYYTRLDDSDPALSDRVNLANYADADLFVSVHINSVKGTSGEGVEVMYNELAAESAFDTKDLAQLLLDKEVEALGAKNRGLVAGHKIYIIRSASMPAALVEVGFMNNPTELAKLVDASYQKQAATGIYHAILASLRRLDKIEGE